ncbi:MAG: hypothetical protein AAFO91_16305, partial [Bacteroidota bacterium]
MDQSFNQSEGNSDQPVVSDVAPSTALPSVNALVGDAWRFTWHRYDIALWYLLVTVLPLFVLAIAAGFAFTFG